ncbi:MAG: PDZ domain-containing protein [Lysobacteraceae bacterium]
MRILSFLLLVLAATAADADSPTKLLRFPDIHGERVVFVHAGDLYIAPLAGGSAFRLTSHPGQELYPKFSPDGNWIAFSAEYNGTRQVHVIPSGGGEPRQLTWYNDVGPMPPRGGTDNRVLDWTPDGAHIAVRMNRTPWSERDGRPYLVPFAGGLEQPLAIPESGGGSFSPDGGQFVYTPIDRDFRNWKRYRGGRAQDVWIYDLNADVSRRLTDHRATDHQPMWLDDTIYFVSDRDYTLNLYAISPAGGEPRKLTDFSDFDVLWPSAGPGGIVFEKGGSIWHYSPADGATREIPIRVQGDWPETLPRFVEGRRFIDSFDIAPGGERAVFGARGEVFTVPARHGEIRQLAHTPDAREHSVSWSPDGKWIAYLSDASGEYEIYLRAQDGSGVERRITNDGDTWRMPPTWSPDSSRLAYTDTRNRLRIVEVASGRTIDADRALHEAFDGHVWSPDSRWLAYAKTNASRNSAIWLYSLDSGRARQLTGDETVDFAPAFDPQGRYLYFLSNRDHALTFSAYEFNYLYTNATRVYAATLAADGPALLRPKSDEVGAAADKAQGKDKAKPDGKATPVPRLRIDLPGFEQRVVALPAPAGNYAALGADADGVFYLSNSGGGNELTFLGLDAEAPEAVARVQGYRLSADGKKLLLQRGFDFAIVDAKPKADFDAGKLDLAGMEVRIEPRREWKQLFVDGWRVLRDWFYDEGMHGQDWNALRARYEPLVEHVASRADLDYLLQELGGEANAGHVYVEAGDQAKVPRKPGGLLGADLQPHASGYWRIARIYAGENWDPTRRSPLTEPGVEVKEGDLLLSIDGVSTRGVDNIYRLLENKADKVVALGLAASADPSAARSVRVKTISSELSLRYLDRVRYNQRRVDELSGGRIGYIHLPNTAVDGNRELSRGMLAYAAREALIIDDRYNGGGFIPDRMIEILARKPLNYWKRRGLEPYATPLLSHLGPKAMLINGLSSSGGDALPYYFRKLGLGPLIGTRTWGGLIGISGAPMLVDGGRVLPATFRFLDTDGRWAVENEGVAPDIEVIDRPELIAAGRDPSLEAAVAHLLRELEKNPPRAPTAPPAPTDFPPH